MLTETIGSIKYQNEKSYYTLQGYSHSFQGWIDPFAAFFQYDFLNLDYTLQSEMKEICRQLTLSEPEKMQEYCKSV